MAAQEELHPDGLPQVSFLRHLFELAQQTAIALGEAENPITKRREANLPAARYLIDTLAMLQEKTEGHRSDEEEQYLTGILSNLRLSFVDKSK